MTDSILVLDAHRNFYDIFATARHLQRTRHPKRLLLPAAGYLFYLPLVKNFLRFLARRYHLEYFPVYRQVEYSPLNLSMRLFVSFYPASLTPKKRQAANRHFISECSRALQKPGNIVLVSPYGSPVLFGGKVKYGVRQLMKVAPQILLSSTSPSLSTFPFHTKLTLSPDNPHNLALAYRSIT